MRYDELRRRRDAAVGELAHAQAAVEREVGDRLRRQQEVALSVLQKVNGLPVSRAAEDGFVQGCAGWAVQLAGGFEVDRLTSSRVFLRSLITTEVQQKAVVLSVPVEVLSYSDRTWAKLLRRSAWREKLADRPRRGREAAREARRKESRAQRLLLEAAELQSSARSLTAESLRLVGSPR